MPPFTPPCACYSTALQNVRARDISVPGLPRLAAGADASGNDLLSSLATIFSLGHDITWLIQRTCEMQRKQAPARPATQANVPGV